MYNDTEHDFALSPNITQRTTAVNNITITTESTGGVFLESSVASSTTTSAPEYINYTIISNETGEVIVVVEKVTKYEIKPAVSG